MMYLIYGDEPFLVKEKISEILNSKKRPIPAPYVIEKDTFSPEHTEKLLRDEGLFKETRIIIASDLLSQKEFLDITSPLLTSLSSSAGTILILKEVKVEKKALSLLKNNGAKIYECNAMTPTMLYEWARGRAAQKQISINKERLSSIIQASQNNLWAIENALELFVLKHEGENFSPPNALNLFAFIDLLMERRTVDAYQFYHQALRQGVSNEEFFWKIYWQYKTLLAVAPHMRSPSSFIQKQTGLHPFVIKKSLKILSSLPIRTAQEIFEWLIFLWEESKLKARDLASELEYFILTSAPLRLPSRFI